VSRWCAGVDDPRARAFLAVGSNIQPESNVAAALELLAGTPGITLAGISTFYRTPPLPGPGADPADPGPGQRTSPPDFLNGVLEIRTELASQELQRVLQEAEIGLGRLRTGDRFAPRTMDFDLLLYSPDRRSHGAIGWAPVRPDGSSIHPDVRSRSFVALPLFELAPDLELPPDGTPLRDVAGRFPPPCGVPETGLTEMLRRRFLPP
jgi:2-amino-4-hydroxy-6-hydroxymethyldihydropteridine diphosphokinase